MAKTCISIQNMLLDEDVSIYDKDALNKSAATLWKTDFEAAKKKIKEWGLKYANDEYNGSLSDIIVEQEKKKQQDDNKHITNLVCENCGVAERNIAKLDWNSDGKEAFTLLYSDNAKIEMNTFECNSCGFILPRIMNIEDTKYRNDDIPKILKTLPLPQDIVMIIMKYWLEGLIGKNIYCIWSRPENYSFPKQDRLLFLLAVKIIDIDLSQILNNKLYIGLYYIKSGTWSDNANANFNNVKVDLLNNNGYIILEDNGNNGNSNKCWVTCIASILVKSDYYGRSYRQQIYVKTLTGKTITVDVDCSKHAVMDAKIFIYHKEGIPPNQQRLIVCAKEMENHRTLSDYNVVRDASIHLVLRLPGG